MTRRDRWQLISSDEVWMFPADIQLSTVELPREFYPDTPYESCLFFTNGDSDVVARYANQQEAIEGHLELEKKHKLKRCSKLKI